MPQIWNEIVVVTQDELSPWYTPTALRQHICRHKDKNYGIKKAQSGGNGRQLLLKYDTLPNEIKNVLKDPRKFDHILEMYYKTDEEAIKFFQDYQFDDGTYLSFTHQEQYITNASILKTIIKLRSARISERKAKGGSIKRGLMSSLLNDAQSFNEVLNTKHNVKHNLPTSEKRFKKALSDFEKEGYKSLISKRHKNSNSKKMTDDLLSLLNSLFTEDTIKPTRTEVARRYEAFLGGYIEVSNLDTGEIYNPKNFQSITEASVRNWLGKWNQKIATYALRTGNRQEYNQIFKPYHTLKQPKYAGSIISIDDRQPPFTYGNSKRAWFYLGIDLGAEVFTTWVNGKTKEGIILDFYRQMVRNYTEWGLCLPAELEAEMSLNSSFVNTFLTPGRMFEHVHIAANNARAKRIERYFRDMRYGIEKDQEGWLGRPFAKSESNQLGAKKAPEVPYNTIIQNGLRNIQKWNNMPHSKHKDISRWDWFIQNQNPNLKPINYKGIIPFLGYKTTTSCNAGIVKLQNTEFLLGDHSEIVFGERLINLLTTLEDVRFDVYWLDGNNGEVIKAYVYLGDQYICELIKKPTYSRARIEQTDEDLNSREIMSHYVASITGYLKTKKNSIDKLFVVDNRVETLGNSFQIKGLDGASLDAPADYDYDNNPVEILPDLTEDQTTDYIPSTKSLKDRF